MPEEEVEINSFHYIINSKVVLKMEAVEVSKKRKFQTDQSELSLLPMSKHACFNNVSCSNNTNGNSELDSEDSVAYTNSNSMDFSNEIEMKEESSGSCGVDKMMMSFDFIQKLEDYSEKDIENILYLHEEEEEEANESNNDTKYVLSSGRWTVNQDSSQHDTMKPTIDQEFEQYFSTLML